jgi:ABC-type dipeptide/oligopeptide/nickel transport system ATPase component
MPKLPTLATLVKDVATKALVFSDESPFSATIKRGDMRLIVVTGENACGKSVFARVLATRVHQRKATPVTISIRERTGGGDFEMARMRQAFMFGTEQDNSTGANSIGVVKRAIEHNLDRDNGCALILDEPEIGLSESYARAMGEYIGQSIANLPKGCMGIAVVTHSRPLAAGILQAGISPTHAAISASDRQAVLGLQEWIDTPEHRSVDELLNLEDIGLERWRALNKLIES